MAERNMRVRLGGFVAVALTVLTGMVVTFGGTPTLFTTTTRYAITFPEAPGVAPGTPVRKSGVRIGQVTGLDIDEDSGLVRLTVEINPKHLPRQNEEPYISRGLLSGDTTLDFIPRTDEKNVPIARGDVYPAGAQIVGVPPLNTQRLINQAQGTIPNAQEALAQFNRTIGKFEQVGPKAERAFDEITALVKSAREVVPELRQTNVRLQEFIGAADPDPEQPGNLKTLTKEVQDFLKAVKPLADDVRAVIKDNREEIQKAVLGLRLLVDRGTELLSDDNRKALTALLQSLQTASKELLSDDNRKAVADILKNLKGGTTDLPATMTALNRFAVNADAAAKDIGTAAKDIGAAAKDVGPALKDLNARIAQAKGILDNLEKATKPLAEAAEPTIKNIGRAADELAKTVADARQVIALLTKSDGTLGKVVNDPQLYNQLVDAAVGLTRTLVRAEKIAKDLEVFADKVARKPETIGVGGALRPSTGLKESPFAPVPSSTPYPSPAPAGTDGGVRPIAPVPGGTISGTNGDDPIPPVSSFKVVPQPGPRVTPPVVVRPQVLGEPR
jgi:ABC-type transporter Mla subunit MlaD